MALQLINASNLGQTENVLAEYCQKNDLSVILEWKDGQYWLHSDRDEERPVTIQLDQELNRHEEYFKKSSIHKELLARAIGVKGAYRPRVVDLTAGLLGDTLLMLAMGCEVVAIERHPLVQLLIESALKNAKHPALSRLQFLTQDAATFLDSASQWDTLYFDPMFEDANHKTAPRKEMRIFRHFLGSDADAEGVFQVALSAGAKRLVVKRPRYSIPLAAGPQVEFLGKSTRYDVYLGVR